jgi:hypothetical protein
MLFCCSDAVLMTMEVERLMMQLRDDYQMMRDTARCSCSASMTTGILP